jgi:hypothetical protein
MMCEELLLLTFNCHVAQKLYVRFRNHRIGLSWKCPTKSEIISNPCACICWWSQCLTECIWIVWVRYWNACLWAIKLQNIWASTSRSFGLWSHHNSEDLNLNLHHFKAHIWVFSKSALSIFFFSVRTTRYLPFHFLIYSARNHVKIY